MSNLDCSYRNTSDRMVILRSCGPEEFFLERVVFPFELLSFSCPAGSEVKIWTHGLGGAQLIESLQAKELLCNCSSEAMQGTELASPWLVAS